VVTTEVLAYRRWALEPRFGTAESEDRTLTDQMTNRTPPRAVHVTTVHSADDTRILYRECASLARAGWDVVLLAPALAASEQLGVRIVPLPRASSRLVRMLLLPWRAFRGALREEGTVYHFHDPELLPLALLLQLTGHCVVFDSHEDHVAAMQYRDYLSPTGRWIAARTVEVVQRLVLPRLSGLVAATPAIESLMLKYNSRVALVQNFPLAREMPTTFVDDEHLKEQAVVYVGAISHERGISHMVDAVAIVAARRECRLLLAGDFSDSSLRRTLEESSKWQNVEFHGRVDRAGVARLLQRARAGLIVSHPNANYVVSYATKMFEYMSAGIPVIASDFPIWRTIFERYDCGEQVNPLDVDQIATAIERCLDSPQRAREAGMRGRAAVQESYCWEPQEQSLLALYDSIAPESIVAALKLSATKVR
jgi:glycosyltransferase involved in cell wall biosynthesis